MRIAIAAVRLVLAVLILAAIVATYIETANRNGGPPNPLNFFGYFTIQSNILGALALTASGILLLRGRRGPGWIPDFRGAVVAYLAVVGIVYAVLLAPLGVEGGVPVPWANTVMHLVSPIAIALDWILVADRPPLRWRRLWVCLPYPAVWLAVVLARGASDGWVPYPFLNPDRGAAAVAIVCVGIAFAILVAAALATALSRVRLLLADSTDTMKRRPGAAQTRDAREGAAV